MTKRRCRTNNPRPSAEQAASAPPRPITRLRLSIPGAATGETARLSAMLLPCPDKGQRTYRLLATTTASMRPKRPSTSLRRPVLSQKRRGWPHGGTVEAAGYTGLGGACVLLALLGRCSGSPLLSPRSPGAHPTYPRRARAPLARPR